MVESASNGCDFCALVAETARNIYSISTPCSIDKAQKAFDEGSRMDGAECLISQGRISSNGIETLIFSVPYRHVYTSRTEICLNYVRVEFAVKIMPGNR
jgi:hypothetical protein